ncbi:MAG: nucleotidyltransferase family protein [Sphingomonadales bacterium]|nr:nucleotidyltransferase family protein [Sphingomonadales bacterium]
MREGARLLLTVLKNPARQAGLSADAWSQVLYLARACGLLGRVAADAERYGLLDSLAAGVRDQLIGARRVAEMSRTRLLWEMDRVRRATLGSDIKIVLLKGAAYVAAGLPCAAGRVSSDIDVMVGRDSLQWLEATLMAAGWQQVKSSNYDQQYYRDWMHELPPLRHPERNAVIDIHHTILPPTSRYKPDPAKLLANARMIDERFAVFSDTDLLLHSAAHLFADGELRGGLRDLVDQRDLIAEFGRDAAFWQRLKARAEELGLTRPLAYSLSYAHDLLAAPVPAEVLTDARRALPWPPLRWVMDWCVRAALIPPHLFDRAAGAAVAGELLYIRSHWLRMPPLMLARHLGVKVWRRTLGSRP